MMTTLDSKEMYNKFLEAKKEIEMNNLQNKL